MPIGERIPQMDIEEGSRHQKIIGDFGENLVCNWLSRSGFEVARVDHTGLDLIAYQRHGDKDWRIGISVKSRTRLEGHEKAPVNLFSHQGNKNEVKTLLDACSAFACEPWIAVYVECTRSADLYLTSLEHYHQMYSSPRTPKIEDWKMTDGHVQNYEADPEVMHIKIVFHGCNWPPTPSRQCG
jgi:hypothetical protein